LDPQSYEEETLNEWNEKYSKLVTYVNSYGQEPKAVAEVE
jgi:hypothetical protein